MSHIITGRPQRPFTRFPDPICYKKEKHRSPFRHKQSCVAVLDRLDTNKKGNFGQRGWSPDCFVSEIYPIWGQSRKQLCHRLLLRTPETMFVDLYKIGSRTAFLTRIQWGTLRSDDSNGNENGKKARSNKQNHNSARASRFFVHFFAVTARIRRENAYVHVLWKS